MKKNFQLYQVPNVISLQDMLMKSYKKYSEKLAIEDINETLVNRLTYKELMEHVLKFGMGLRNLGINERTHIGVISENRVQWGLTYLTAAMFNFVIVPIDRNLSNNEILNIIHESEIEVIVFSDLFSSLLTDKFNAFKKLKYYINMDIAEDGERFLSMKKIIDQNRMATFDEITKVNPDDLFEIIFTSGSIGRAKGVMLSQKNIVSNLVAMTSMIFIEPTDKFLSVLPIHHTYECTCGFLCPIYSGASVHYARSLKTVVDDLQKVKATVLLGVPLLFEKMYKRITKGIEEDKKKSRIVPPLLKITNVLNAIGAKEIKKKVFSELHQKFGGSIRMFIVGGAAPDPKTSKGLREFGFTFIQGYGLTETSPIVALNRLDFFKDEAAGIPLPNVTVKINNQDSDGIGEVFVKGDSVMLGYYKNEELTKETFSDGWFKTGDLGFVDKDGFLHICGRMKNVIIANNGKNVFPEEIEDLLNRSQFIQESLVYGEKDSKKVEVICAKIVVDAESFIEYCNKNNKQLNTELVNEIIGNEIKELNKKIPNFKQINKFTIREQEFEKTTTQKIKRYAN